MTPPRLPAPVHLRRRFLWCVVLVLAAFSVLCLRLVYLQVLEGSRYRHLSENNRIRIERLPAPRGIILDRTGEVLAEVRATFDALVIPAEMPLGERARVYRELETTLGLDGEAVAQAVEGPGPLRWKPRILKRHLTRPEMARLEARRLELPGVVVQATPVRFYPFGDLLGSTLGYVGEISAEELRQPAYAEYEPGDALGRTGLERAWEGELRGDAGGQQVEVDVRGRRLQVLAVQHARPGHTVTLTVDRRLQQAALDALGEESGAVAVVGVRTGDVLALASRPGFDPNVLAKGVTAAEWAALSSDPLHPLQNRAIQGLYPPASTFKIVTALAGLAEGVITPQTRVFCSGSYTFAGRPYRCWKRTGHGSMDLREAMIQSCDVYFYQLGLDLGIDAIERHSLALGLGRPTGLDIPSEKGGLVPSREWKRRARREPWYTGETLSVAIGQGYLLTTPLQLASMMAGLAHPEGVRMRSRIVTGTEDAQGRPLQEVPSREIGRLGYRRAHLDLIRDSLRGVVASERGTGRRAEVAGFPVAGKTGTAQVVKLPAEAALPQDSIPREHRDHAWFVCYAPVDDPEIAVAVLVEHAGQGGGAVAAPVARKVVEAYRSLRGGAVTLGEAGR
ncbi:MAG: penicillin-binding protein 2 [Deferrisomatales bacterium]